MLRVVVALLVIAGTASAETPWLDRKPAVVSDSVERTIVDFVVRGDTKTKRGTIINLAHYGIGYRVRADLDVPKIREALLSSELFESVEVELELRDPGTVAVVVDLVDKHSWIVAPTVYVLPQTWAVGFGFAENDWGGRNRKLLLYGQVGNRNSFFFGTYLDPAVRGSKLTWRFDLYPLRRQLEEYANPAGDPSSTAILRSSTLTFLNAGALVGWNFAWWLATDLRLRSAYVQFTDPRTPSGAVAAQPETNGWDTSVQARVTLDARGHQFGVTWGPYLQLWLEASVPGLDDYGYQEALFRAWYSWRLAGDQQLEIRTSGGIGRNFPLHEDLTIGGIYDLRGYGVDQFRGDTRLVARGEYSIPIARWRIFAFRALAFYDAGYIATNHPRTTGRDYLPGEDAAFFRSDAGGGLRIYVKNVVLPLLGFDIGYGLQAHSPSVYFEVGLTDF